MDNLTSDHIAARSVRVPTFGDVIRGNPFISSASRFDDDAWLIDVTPPAALRIMRVDWSGVATRLRRELKYCAWLTMVRPRGRLKAVSMAVNALSLARIGSWLGSVGIDRIALIDEGTGDEFVKSLAEWFRYQKGDAEHAEAGWDPRVTNADGETQSLGFGRGLSYSLVRRCAAAFILIHNLRILLTENGVEPPSGGAPFGGLGATAVVGDHAEVRRQIKERIPDEVLVPLLTAAERMTGVPADDVIKLLLRMDDIMRSGATEAEAARSCVGFGFGTVPGEDSPWREPLDDRTAPATQVRRLVRLIGDAASIVVLGEVGLRPSELVGLEGGRKTRSGFVTKSMLLDRHRDEPGTRIGETMPACVSEGLTKSGMTIASYLHGFVFKQQSEPKSVHWLLGGRHDLGDDPPAYRAIDVLERIHATWRVHGDERARGLLIVDLANDPDEPSKAVDRTVLCFTQSIYRTISRLVDLSRLPIERSPGLRRYRDTNGRCISVYQFRRTFAQLIFRMDARLIGPLARQLKHLSTAVTAECYVTNDPILQRELEDFRSRETVLMYERLLGGETSFAGTMGAIVQRTLTESRERLNALPRTERSQEVARLTGAGSFKVHFAEDNDCYIGLRPKTALCNIAERNNHWIVDVPNLAVRDPDMCAECPNSSFDRVRHGPMILARYISNMRTWQAAEARGEGRMYRAWRERGLRDARILGDLGLPVPTKEEITRG